MAKLKLSWLEIGDIRSHIPHPKLSQIKKALKVVHNN
jgi:hypothetical protein